MRLVTKVKEKHWKQFLGKLEGRMKRGIQFAIQFTKMDIKD